MTIYPYQGKTPQIHPSAFIAPGAMIIGDVTIGPDASIWYNCVLRADVNRIVIGARSNVQDGTVMHVDSDAEYVLGDDTTVGHQALVHGARVGDGALIGMGSRVLSRSVVGDGALVAAGAVVLEGSRVPARSLVAGVPAKVRRELGDEESRAFIPHAARYVELAREHAQLRPSD
ncbi:gamma carbonic anhydrase family protein [Corynebacterium yudongzhengii]|uniref:Gamma carbonic anhydrase family protein n=1 Tax=Corynebacterium yudongzhengii TaxID=2080740 RepID=A0A2U1T876_9CORY|nr:gamma carbonic anhydrase family protein [Corynebacterium yudongzhengii]AWB82729.1 gamma carbonic anhydrase family protein [Corynebacterium yudongzhengii]PWC02210.1 gamma carbonic anhydrase family protein [Corynebacterium yudongzhengii]